MISVPPKDFLRSTFRVAFLAWVGLRAIVVLAWLVLRAIVGSPQLSLPASIFLIFGVTAVALVENSVSRERLFYANLGVGRRVTAGIAMAVATGLEVMAGLAFRVLL